MTRPVLLVSPGFHGYWAGIQAALERRGHDVVAHCYDASGGALVATANAIAHRTPGKRIDAAVARRATLRAVDVLRRVRPGALLVVKGDRLTDEWWDAVAALKVPTVLWLYDELARMRYDFNTLREVGAVLSYSPRDVATLRTAGVDAGHLPDGFDSLTPFASRPSDAVTLVGARYPERERLLRSLHLAGVHVRAYGREWSRHPWDVVRTGRWRASGVPASRDLPRAEYYGVMAGAAATINVHSSGHDGLAMRTFEAPGVGALHLVDRPDVAEYYEVGRETLLFSGSDQLLDHLARARREPEWTRGIREAGARRTAAEHTLVHRMAEVERRWR